MNRKEMMILKLTQAQQCAMLLEIARMDLEDFPLTDSDLRQLIAAYLPTGRDKKKEV